MKAIKYLIWLLLVLIVIAVGSVIFITNVVDPNDYKPKIAELVKKQTGRDLSLDGELSLTFFPWVGVETGKLSLSNAEGFGDAPMVSVDNARAKVKLLPLLKKLIEVDTVVLEKPVVRLSARKDGTTNWDDLLKAGASAQTNQGGEEDDAAKGAGAIAGLAVQGVSISDGFVEWVDGRTDQNLTLKQLNLTTGTLVPGDPLDITLTVNAEGNLIPEPAAVALDTTVIVNEGLTAFTLDGTEFSVKMDTIGATLDAGKVAYGLETGIAAISGLAADVSYKGVDSSLKASQIDLDTKAETLSLPDLAITQGDANIAASFSGTGILSAPAGAGKLDVKAADINTLLQTNGIEIPQLTQSLKNLALSSAIRFADNQLDLSAVSLDADVNSLPTTVRAKSVSVGIASQSFRAEALDIKQTDFSLALDSVDMPPAGQGNRIAGIEVPAISGNLSASLSDLAALLERNGVEVDLPELPITNFNLSASLDSSKKDTIAIQSATIKLDHRDQPTSIVIPGVTFGGKNNALNLERIEITQGDTSLVANASGSNVAGDLAAMNLKGNLVAKVPDLSGLLQRNAIAVELPQGLLSSVSTSAGFALSDNNLSISKLDAQLDEMTIRGDARLVNLSKPGYQFDLVVNKLDIDSLVAKMGQGEESGESTQTPSTAEQLLLPVAPLRGLNVDGKAKIGQMITTGITLDDVNIVVKSDKNVLRIVPVTAKLFGGSMESQLTYDVSTDVPAVKTVNKVDSVDIGGLLGALDITDKISGTGNLSTNLSASGADIDKMIASIAGDIDFRLLNGALKGYDLQATLIDLEKQVNSFKGKETTSDETPAAETKFAEFSGSLKAKNGVFRNNDLSMKAPLFRVGGEGVIDLPADRLDYKLDVNVVESVEGQGGASLDDLKGARIPFKIYGPLASPSYTLDLASLVKDRAKKELKKEVKKKLLEELSPDLAKELGLTGGGEAANQAAGQATKQAAEPAAEPVPEDPKEALEEQLKKKLKKSLLKGLFN